MRKITKESIQAFNSATPFNKSNMGVVVSPLGLIALELYGNIIASYNCNDPKKTLSITNCGYFTNTTKERLNGLEGVSVNQSKGLWYLNGNEWDGSLIDLKKDS